MNKEIRIKFIEECKKEDIEDWADDRQFDLSLLKKLGLGRCTEESITRVRETFSLEDLKKANFINTKGKLKYYNRVIIPYSDDYFAARRIGAGDDKYKNLFPNGLSKKLFFIKGKNKEDLFITEGETDAIRLKHIFPDCNMASVGGSKAKKILEEIIKKIILIEPKRVVFCYDNDEAGQEGVKSALEVFANSSKRKYYQDKIFEMKFPLDYKDIDEYFKDGGKIESLNYEKKHLKEIQTLDKDSIYAKPALVLPIDSYYENAKKFHEYQPYFYDKSNNFSHQQIGSI